MLNHKTFHIDLPDGYLAMLVVWKIWTVGREFRVGEFTYANAKNF